MTVTGVDMNRDGIPHVIQQPQVGYSAPLPYGAPVEQLPFSREQTCPCNLSGCGVSFVVDDFSVRFFPGLGNQSLDFSVWAYDSLRLSIFARWFTDARMSKSPRTSTRGWLLCAPISFFFPVFYMLSFALSDVYRELMWPWWRERNFSSPTRSSSSSELGPVTGVCLELNAKSFAAMVTLSVACCQHSAPSFSVCTLRGVVTLPFRECGGATRHKAIAVGTIALADFSLPSAPPRKMLQRSLLRCAPPRQVQCRIPVVFSMRCFREVGVATAPSSRGSFVNAVSIGETLSGESSAEPLMARTVTQLCSPQYKRPFETWECLREERPGFSMPLPANRGPQC